MRINSKNVWDIDYWCVIPLKTIFQLYHWGQYYWRSKQKGQTTICKTLYRKPNIKQHEPHEKLEVDSSCSTCGFRRVMVFADIWFSCSQNYLTFIFFILSVPDKCYSRNASCPLNYISALLLEMFIMQLSFEMEQINWKLRTASTSDNLKIFN